MRGEIDPQQIDVHEARLIACMLSVVHLMICFMLLTLLAIAQLFYLEDRRFALVKKFNDAPQEFDYNELLKF
jgi:hypothetical protein